MSAAAELLGRWTKGCVRLIEPVQFLYSLYLSGSMSLFSQSVRFLVQTSRDPAGGVDPSAPAGGGRTQCGNGSAAAAGDSSAGDVEAEAARWLIYMNIAAVVPALFSTVFLGGFSNRVGRKLVLLLPLVGGALRLLFFITVFTLRLSPAYLVISSFVDGLFGMSCSMLMACFSYASDITTHHQRSIRLVLLQMCSGLALITSSLATGFVIHSLGHVWMFVFLLGILAIAFCYVVFFLQESFVPTPPARDHSCFYWAVEPFVSACSVFRRSNVPGRRCCLSVALLISFLVGFVQLGRTDAQILYLFTYPFCFNSLWIGYYSATFYLVVNVAMILATWTLGRFIGDIGLVFIGTFFGVTYELMFGFAVNTLMIFLAPVVGCAMIIPISLLRAFISKTVEPMEVATAFACFAWLENISGLVGGITQNAIFASTASWKPNAVFFFDAGMYGVTFIVVSFFLYYLRRLRQHNQNRPIINYDGNHSDYAEDESDDVAYLPEQK